MAMLCDMKKVTAFLGKNDSLNPLTLNDPSLTFDPTTQVEALKIMHKHESHGHAM